MRALLALSRAIDALSEGVGRIIVWLVLAVSLLSAGNALMRYAFRYSSNAYLEAQWYLFSLIFLLGGAYALKHNAHVRIDLVYGRLSKRTQAWIDLVGTLLFLIPMSLGVIYLSWDWVANAVAIREMSPDVGAAPLAHQDRPARGVRPSRPPGPLRAHQAAGLSDRAPARLDARGRGGGGLRWTSTPSCPP